MNIPPGQLIRKARQGAMDDLKEIVTYCNGGYGGNIGADELAQKGSRPQPLTAAMKRGKTPMTRKADDQAFNLDRYSTRDENRHYNLADRPRAGLECVQVRQYCTFGRASGEDIPAWLVSNFELQ